MSHIRPIFLIAGNTVTGVLRGVVLNVLLVLAALSVIFAMSTSGMDNEGQLRRTLVDSGLAIITVLGAMITILTGFIMIPAEIDSRTAYPVLSKPVRRWQFVLGKFFGAAGINGITVGLLAVLFFLLYFIKMPTHEFDPRLIMAVVMIYAQLTILSSIIIFFSTFMSWIGTIIVSMIVWFIGSYSMFIQDMAGAQATTKFASIISTVVQKALPNFQAMDLRYAIVQEEVVHFTAKQILAPVGDGVLYLVVALAIAVLIFNYREL